MTKAEAVTATLAGMVGGVAVTVLGWMIGRRRLEGGQW